jgi:hypothetical protein
MEIFVPEAPGVLIMLDGHVKRRLYCKVLVQRNVIYLVASPAYGKYESEADKPK